MYDWSIIAGQLLMQASANYKITGMFLEFANVASPSTVVPPPVFGRSGGMSYYNSLSSSANFDYLRVPLEATNQALASGNSVLTFFAASQGTVGVNGKLFSDTVNSKLIGGALVAIVNPADRSQDLVFSRFYLDTASQAVKIANRQLGLEWQLTLQ